MAQLGAKVRALRAMSDEEFRANTEPNANRFFEDVLDLPSNVEIRVIKDTATVRRIIVPWYGDASPLPETDEAAGVVVLMGCGE
jgi:hypothetical protein